MKWMEERDLLIAQTLAFVESVTGKTPDADSMHKPATPEPIFVAETFAAESVVAEPAVQTIALPDIDAVLADNLITAKPSRPAHVALPEMPVDIQSEIRARVANFRAHQERFRRGREEYCTTTMAKVRASIEDLNLSRPVK